MDYNRIYSQLIERALTRDVPDEYTEAHHIIPKCLNGNDAIENFVRLTFREHYLAHLLLHYGNPTHRGLLLAATLMGMQKEKNGGKRFISSHLYESLKGKLRQQPVSKESREKMSNARKGKRMSDGTKKKLRDRAITKEWRENMRVGQLGRPPISEYTRIKLKARPKTKHTVEFKAMMSALHSKKTVSTKTRKLLRECNLGKTASKETKRKMAVAHTGKLHTDETKQKLRKKQEIVRCPHCDQLGGVRSMKRYHFDNCKGSK